MRLIDADALLKWLSEWELQEAPWWGANGYGDAKVAETIREAIDAVEQMPTIEPKHGKWIAKAVSIKGVPTEACSECCEWSYGDGKPFCPNCGAKNVDNLLTM